MRREKQNIVIDANKETNKQTTQQQTKPTQTKKPREQSSGSVKYSYC